MPQCFIQATLRGKSIQQCTQTLCIAEWIYFINDIDKGIVSKLLKFADDTKLVGTVCTEVELEQLRTDLKRLYS